MKLLLTGAFKVTQCFRCVKNLIGILLSEYKVKLAGSEGYRKLDSFDDGYYEVESLGKKSQTPDMILCVNSKTTENGNGILFQTNAH